MPDSTSPLPKLEEKSFLEKAKEKGLAAKDFAEKEYEKIKNDKQKIEKDLKEIDSSLKNLKEDFNNIKENIDTGSGYFGPSIKNLQKRLEDFVPELGLDLDLVTESINKEAKLLIDSYTEEKKDFDLKVKQAIEIGLKPGDKNWDSIVGPEPLKIVGSKVESQEDINIAFEKRKEEYDKRLTEADNLFKTQGIYPPDSPERIRFIGLEPKRDETKALVIKEVPPETWIYNSLRNEYSNSKGEVVNPEQYRIMFPQGPFEGRVERRGVATVKNSPLRTEIYLDETQIKQIIKSLFRGSSISELSGSDALKINVWDPEKAASLGLKLYNNFYRLTFSKTSSTSKGGIYTSNNDVVLNSNSEKMFWDLFFEKMKSYPLKVITSYETPFIPWNYSGSVKATFRKLDGQTELTITFEIINLLTSEIVHLQIKTINLNEENAIKSILVEEKIKTLNNLGSAPLNKDEAKRKIANDIKEKPEIFNKSGELEKIIKGVETQITTKPSPTNELKNEIISNLDDSKSKSKEIMAAVNKKMSAFGDNVKQMLGEIKDLLAQIFNQIIVWVKKFVADVKGMFESKVIGATWVPGPMFIKDLLEAARKLYSDISGIKAIVATVISRTKEYSLFTKNIGENIQNKINESIETITQKITSVPGMAERKIKLFGEETINTLKNSKGVEATINNYKQKLIGSEDEATKKLKEVPAKLMKEIIK